MQLDAISSDRMIPLPHLNEINDFHGGHLENRPLRPPGGT